MPFFDVVGGRDGNVRIKPEIYVNIPKHLCQTTWSTDAYILTLIRAARRGKKLPNWK
jgi:hypothetical protein